MAEWREVLTTLVEGPHAPIHGTISRTAGAVPHVLTGIAGVVPPLYVGADDLQIWRVGRKVRVESADGRPVVISNGVDVWRFTLDGEPPVRCDHTDMRYMGPGRELLTPQLAARWHRTDVTRFGGAVSETQYLGRDCWTAELVAPDDETQVIQLVVDQRTGAVIQQRNSGAGDAVGFTQFTAGIPIDSVTFSWTGYSLPGHAASPAVTNPQVFLDAAQRRHKQNQRWIALNVTDRQLVVPTATDLSIVQLQDHAEDGSFEAIIGSGAITGRLARRPRRASIWYLNFGTETQAWSTERYDWAVAMYTGPLDTVALAALQDQLHPEHAIVGQPTVVRATDDLP